MASYTLKSRLTVPVAREEVFEFFSDARNLERITPGWLRFEIVSDAEPEIREGLLIDYRLRIRGLPIRWRSEITVWEPPHRFVDEQRRGPYREWVHEHRFESTPEGTDCHDRVDFSAPGGALVARWLVVPDIRRIFQHRSEALARRFGADPATAELQVERRT